MPIYTYGCSSCGVKKDVMQKMSDAPLKTCPDCGQETFTKQLTAAGFQLKGSGYYVTDFKGGPKQSEGKETKPEDKPNAKEAKPDAVSVPAPAASPAAVTNGTV